MGAAVGLPLLDAMVPARKLWASTAAAASVNSPRMVCIENVHGAAGCNELGATQNLWAPGQVGRDFDLSPGSGPLVEISDTANAKAIADSIRLVRDATATGMDEIIVDNTDAGATFTGTWSTASAVKGF